MASYSSVLPLRSSGVSQTAAVLDIWFTMCMSTTQNTSTSTPEIQRSLVRVGAELLRVLFVWATDLALSDFSLVMANAGARARRPSDCQLIGGAAGRRMCLRLMNMSIRLIAGTESGGKGAP